MTIATKYVIAKFTNSGMGDHLSCLIGAWWYAKNTKRTLLIDWRGSHYAKDDDNCFLSFFHFEEDTGVPIIADNSISQISYADDFYPKKWNRSNINSLEHRPHTASEIHQVTQLVHSCIDRNESTIVFNQHISSIPIRKKLYRLIDSLRPAAAVEHIVSQFNSQHMAGKKVLGVHIRHGNGENIGDRAQYWIGGIRLFQQIRLNKSFNIHLHSHRKNTGQEYGKNGETTAAKSLVRVNGHLSLTEKYLYKRIFAAYDSFKQENPAEDCCLLLCTDSKRVIEFVQRGVNDTIIFHKKMLSLGAGPLHQQSQGTDNVSIEPPISADLDTFVEMELLRRSDAIICIPSQFSLYPRLSLAERSVTIIKPPIANRIISKLANLN
jgi:hypothetical protein